MYFLEMHLHTLKAILPQCLPNVKGEINLMGCIELSAWMHAIIQYKPPQVSNTHQPEALAYLHRELERIRLDAHSDMVLEHQSRMLSEMEEKILSDEALNVVGL